MRGFAPSRGQSAHWPAQPALFRSASIPALCLALLLAAPAPLVALGTGFTYQGRLQQSGLPASGICNFRFSLYDGPGDDAIRLWQEGPISLKVRFMRSARQ